MKYNIMASPYHEISLKIHVGSIPADSTEEDLYSYFANFGKIMGIQLSRRFKTRSSTMLNQGSCVLMAGDHQTVEMILATPHNFEGRKLKCHRFVEGEALQELNRSNNERRLIIKNVHRDVQLQILHEYLVQFGEIECLFFLHQTRRLHRFRTASVQFTTKESADHVLERPSFKINGSKIKIQSYNHEFKRPRRTSQPINQRLPGTSSASSDKRNQQSNPTANQQLARKSPPLSIETNHSLKPTKRAYFISNLWLITAEGRSPSLTCNIRYNLLARARPRGSF